MNQAEYRRIRGPEIGPLEPEPWRGSCEYCTAFLTVGVSYSEGDYGDVIEVLCLSCDATYWT